MLVEQGLTRITAPDGTQYTFRPSLGRIAALGHPAEIVCVFVALFGRYAAREARFVLSVLCDQEDVAPLLGWLDDDGWHAGQMPEDEQVAIAAHLLRHGMIGTAMAGKGDAQGVAEFNAAEYAAAARVHLGMSAADAQSLSMTEFQALFEMKFPDAKGKKRDVATREEYLAAMAAMG